MVPAPMMIHQSLATEIMYNLREQLEECTRYKTESYTFDLNDDCETGVDLSKVFK